MHRIIAVTALVLSLSFVGVRDLLAQRSGFIIGFGIGPGVTTWTESLSECCRAPKVGLATDFKIGAQVSQSLQIYYLGRTTWWTGGSLILAGILALGVTYVLPSAPVHLSGGIGGSLVGASESGTGLGFTGGVGWEFADLWLLDVAVTYGMPGNINMFQARAGISILSH